MRVPRLPPLRRRGRHGDAQDPRGDGGRPHPGARRRRRLRPHARAARVPARPPPPPPTPRVPQEAVPLEPHAAAHPLARDRGRGGLLHHPQFGHQGPDLLEPDGPPAPDRAMVFRPGHGRASAALGRAEDASLHVKARRPPSLSSRRLSARLGPRARAGCRRTFPSSTSQRTRRPSRSSSKICRPTRTSSIFTACPSRSSTSRTLVAGAVSKRRPASRSPGGRPSTCSTSNSFVSLRTLVRACILTLVGARQTSGSPEIRTAAPRRFHEGGGASR